MCALSWLFTKIIASVGIVRVRTKVTEFSLVLLLLM